MKCNNVISHLLLSGGEAAGEEFDEDVGLWVDEGVGEPTYGVDEGVGEPAYGVDEGVGDGLMKSLGWLWEPKKKKKWNEFIQIWFILLSFHLFFHFFVFLLF